MNRPLRPEMFQARQPNQNALQNANANARFMRPQQPVTAPPVDVLPPTAVLPPVSMPPQASTAMPPPVSMPPQAATAMPPPVSMPPQAATAMPAPGGKGGQMPSYGFMGQNPEGRNELLQRIQGMAQGKGGTQAGGYAPPNNMANPTPQTPAVQPPLSSVGGKGGGYGR